MAHRRGGGAPVWSSGAALGTGGWCHGTDL